MKAFDLIVKYKSNPGELVRRIYYTKLMKYPSGITLIVSKNCNLNCGFCFIKSWLADDYASDMTLENMKSVVDRTCFFKPLYMLYGGEPLLNSGIFELIHYIKSCGCSASMVTNATLINEKNARELAVSGLQEISVSLDGLKKTHDSSRGVPAFDRAFKGLKTLKKQLDEHKSSTKIRVICTFTPDFTEGDMEFILSLKENGIADNLQFNHLIFRDDVSEDVLGKHRKLKKFFNLDHDVYFPKGMDDAHIKEWYTKGWLSKEHWKCNPSGITVYPNGDVTDCMFRGKDKIIGNILKQDIKEILANPIRNGLGMNKYDECYRCCIYEPKGK